MNKDLIFLFSWVVFKHRLDCTGKKINKSYSFGDNFVLYFSTCVTEILSNHFNHLWKSQYQGSRILTHLQQTTFENYVTDGEIAQNKFVICGKGVHILFRKKYMLIYLTNHCLLYLLYLNSHFSLVEIFPHFWIDA